MSDDDVKARILARRAKFLAAALSGAGLAATAALVPGLAACGDDQVTEPADGAAPQPCLSPLAPDSGGVPPDASPDGANPQPCLSPLPPDAGDDAGDASDDAAGDAEPMPCLAPIP